MHHFTHLRMTNVLLVLLTTLALVAAACGSDEGSENADTDAVTQATDATSDGSSTSTDTTAEDTATEDTTTADEEGTVELPESLSSDWVGSYERVVDEFGTMVTVTVADGTRTIESNALPDHDTGDFPNEGNPNTIEEQSLTWTYAATGTNTGSATSVRTTGVAINGVKFEPGTGETVSCDSGENYRIEAIQDLYDLGLDFNNAHVQPDGEYHYHGVSSLLVDIYDNDNDLVHIGFAADGNLIYFSKSSAYSPSYVLSDDDRTGSDCTSSGRDAATVEIDGTTPDGTYTSDWTFDATAGDLDDCNGITIDGQYVYVATESYPFIGRCVMGEAEADGPGGGAPPEGAPGGEPGDDQ